jgi:hypothetical protein
MWLGAGQGFGCDQIAQDMDKEIQNQPQKNRSVRDRPKPKTAGQELERPVPSEVGRNNYVEVLHNTTKITVLEANVSIGKEYGIYVNGKKVATVAGKNFKILTDRFDLKTIDGRLLAYETERDTGGVLYRAATFYDSAGNVTGSSGEEYDSGLMGMFDYYIFHFYDTNDQKTGTSGKISNSALLGDHKIKDLRGGQDYDIDKKN